MKQNFFCSFSVSSQKNKQLLLSLFSEACFSSGPYKHPRPKTGFPNASSSHLAVLQHASSLANMEDLPKICCLYWSEKGRSNGVSGNTLGRKKVIQWRKLIMKQKYQVNAKLVFWEDFLEQNWCALIWVRKILAVWKLRSNNISSKDTCRFFSDGKMIGPFQYPNLFWMVGYIWS